MRKSAFYSAGSGTLSKVLALGCLLSVVWSFCLSPCTAWADQEENAETVVEEVSAGDDEGEGDAAQSLSQEVLDSTKPDFYINAKSVYLVNLDTDQVIYERNADAQTFPASLAKIMTAILVMENVSDLEGETVQAQYSHFDEFVGQNVSSADIRAGEEFTVMDYLYALMVPSGNEAANILADYVGPGVDAFVEKMNQRAQELGCTNTHFTNPHGLADDDQYTSARDMYLIARHAYDIPGFMDIVSSIRYTLPATDYTGERLLISTNKMMEPGSIYYDSAVKGIKTGTLEGGRCFVSTASKNGMNYMLVLMNVPFEEEDGTESDYNLSFIDAGNLYDWVFSTFTMENLLNVDQIVDEIGVSLAWEKDFIHLYPEKQLTALVPADLEEGDIQRVITKEETAKAPIQEGQVLGSVEILLRGQSLGSVNLVAGEAVPRSNLLYYLDLLKSLASTWWFKTLVISIVVLCILYSISCVLINRRRRRYKNIRRRRDF